MAKFFPTGGIIRVFLVGDIHIANFQVFGSLLFLTGYRFSNPYRKVPEVSLQVR